MGQRIDRLVAGAQTLAAATGSMRDAPVVRTLGASKDAARATHDAGRAVRAAKRAVRRAREGDLEGALSSARSAHAHGRRFATRVAAHVDSVRPVPLPGRVPSITQLRAMDPSEFEQLVASGLRERGYRDVRHSGRSGDAGIDVHARDAAGRSVVTQVKRHGARNTVGGPTMQSFLGAMQVAGADRGIFVTTSTFTRAARDAARIGDVELYDADRLHELLAPAAGR